jgi:hypothetical protein
LKIEHPPIYSSCVSDDLTKTLPEWNWSANNWGNDDLKLDLFSAAKSYSMEIAMLF